MSLWLLHPGEWMDLQTCTETLYTGLEKRNGISQTATVHDSLKTHESGCMSIQTIPVKICYFVTIGIHINRLRERSIERKILSLPQQFFVIAVVFFCCCDTTVPISWSFLVICDWALYSNLTYQRTFPQHLRWWIDLVWQRGWLALFEKGPGVRALLRWIWHSK